MRLLPSAVAALALLSSCKRSEPVVAEPSASAVAAAPSAPPQPSPLEVIRAKKTMADALIVAGPLMTDAPNESSAGTLLFTSWSAERLRWTDLAAAEKHDETSYGRIQKDVDAERMKRMCVTGPVIEIHASKTAIGKFFVGLMQSAAGDLFHFYAVRSTEKVVKGVDARFCGVVTGWYDYPNSAGGTGHAVEIVGMFPLPENRALN